MKNILLLLTILLVMAPRSADLLLYDGGPGAGGLVVYQGPCDVIAGGCAVAYDVDRSPTATYRGALFELWNGSSTLNIGQTPNHAVDLSTYAAFCGGSMTPTTHNGTAVLVSTTCYYAALYDAIQGSPNTLVPITFNTQFGPNCSAVARTYVRRRLKSRWLQGCRFSILAWRMAADFRRLCGSLRTPTQQA